MVYLNLCKCVKKWYLLNIIFVKYKIVYSKILIGVNNILWYIFLGNL